MRRVLAPFLALAVLTAACEVGGAPAPVGQAQIIIASDLPSSAFGSNTVPLEQAIALAIRQKGSIAGFKLDYWPLDDSLAAIPSPVRGAKNIQRMVAERRVLGMIGPFTSNVAFAEVPMANPSNLAMVSPSASDVCLTVMAPGCDPTPTGLRKSGTNNFFRIEAIDSLEGRAMARYVAANLAVKRVAVLNEWGDVGKQYVDEFAAELARAGGRLVLKQDFDPGTKDFGNFLAMAKTRGAQAVYAVGSAEDGVCLARAQMTNPLPGAYFLGTDGFSLFQDDPSAASPCISDAADTARMLATYIAVDVSNSTDASVKTVVDAYRSAYPQTPLNNPFIFAAYDCARILISAIERAIQANHGAIPTRAQVVGAVAATNEFKGLTGTYSFDANGDARSPLMSLYEVRDGRWVYLQKLDVSAKGA